jgi:hypothetical protein
LKTEEWSNVSVGYFGIFIMKLVTFMALFFILPLCLISCVDDANESALTNAVPASANRVVAKDYQVITASREERQCRYQPVRNAGALFLFEKGQKVSLLSVKEQGRLVDGDLWLHVSAEQEGVRGCFVLASVLAPIASRPVIK